MPSMLLGTLEIEGFGTVMLDSGIWADLDMENCLTTHTAGEEKPFFMQIKETVF